MKYIAKVGPNERLKWEREIRGWSQKYVAEQIDAPSVHYISRWERGLITPGSFYREKLCRLFEKDARELGLLQLTEETDEETTSTAISSSSTAGETSSSGVFLFLTPGSCPVTNLIGREEILSYLSQRLCAGRGGVVTALYGLPGVGKTSLAATFIQRIDVQNFFQDGILWINIGSRPNIAGLLSSCGKLLGLAESEMEKLSSIEARIKAVHVAIGKRQMLLVIDDVWTLEEALPFFKICGVKCAYL